MFQNTYMSISTKLSLTVSLLILILLTVFSSVLLHRENNIMEENLQSKGVTIAQNVGMTCATALMGNDFSFLKQVVTELINDQDIIYAMILNNDHEIIAATPEAAEKNEQIISLNKSPADENVSQLAEFFSDQFKTEVYDIVAPILVDQEKWGYVKIGISLEDMRKRAKDNVIIVVLFSAATVLIGILASFQLGRRISRPIQQLVRSATVISQGNMDEPVTVISNDEIGVLSHAFEKMRTSLKTQISEIAKKAMGLEGDLKVFSLPDLIQMVCQNQQTGILHLTRKESKEWGKVYIKNGEIYDVESNVPGDYETAFFRFFNWATGDFKFDRAPMDKEKKVTMSWQHLIMEGARHTDELERIKQVIPSPDKRIAVVDNPPENVKSIKLTIDELQLSSLIQGKKTVRDILAASPFNDDFKTYKLLYSLISAGLIYVVED